MKKVILPKEVAEAIEIINRTENKAEIVGAHLESPNKWVGEYAAINGLPFDTLIVALYVGYEVEKTPEERVLEFYDYCKSRIAYHNLSDDPGDVEHRDKWENTASTVRYTLNLLNVVIKGVNA